MNDVNKSYRQTYIHIHQCIMWDVRCAMNKENEEGSERSWTFWMMCGNLSINCYLWKEWKFMLKKTWAFKKLRKRHQTHCWSERNTLWLFLFDFCASLIFCSSEVGVTRCDLKIVKDFLGLKIVRSVLTFLEIIEMLI